MQLQAEFNLSQMQADQLFLLLMELNQPYYSAQVLRTLFTAQLEMCAQQYFFDFEEALSFTDQKPELLLKILRMCANVLALQLQDVILVINTCRTQTPDLSAPVRTLCIVFTKAVLRIGHEIQSHEDALSLYNTFSGEEKELVHKEFKGLLRQVGLQDTYNSFA